MWKLKVYDETLYWNILVVVHEIGVWSGWVDTSTNLQVMSSGIIRCE